MRAHRGFTLIEILLALVLMAMLMAGAWAGIRTATRSVERGEALMDRTNKLRVSQGFLRQQLSQALSLPFDDTRAGERIAFEGDREALFFVSPMPGHLSRGGAYVQNLAFERGPNGRRLVFRHTLLNGFDPDEGFSSAERDPVVLLEHIRDARFQYRALDDTGELGDWEDAWDDINGRTPLLVRVEVEFEPESGLVWPELVVPLMIDPAAASLQDPTMFIGGGG